MEATDPPRAAVADKAHGNEPCANKEVSTATNMSGSTPQKKKMGPEGANSGPKTRSSYRLAQESTSSEDVPISCLATRKGTAKAATRLSLKKAMTAVVAVGKQKKTPAPKKTNKTTTTTKKKPLEIPIKSKQKDKHKKNTILSRQI